LGGNGGAGGRGGFLRPPIGRARAAPSLCLAPAAAQAPPHPRSRPSLPAPSPSPAPRWPATGPNSCPPSGYSGSPKPVCVDLDEDVKNCGTCGKDCGSTTPGMTCCNGKCANILKDEQNCGACGKKCVGTDICQFGHCVPCKNNSTYVYGIADNQMIYEASGRGAGR
jgi:hypothetical protein